MEVDDVLGPALLPFFPGEERGPDALAGQQIARGPVRQPQHPPPLAEHDDLARLRERELVDQLAQLQKLRGREAPERGLRRPLDPREIWPDDLEPQLGQARWR